jgi:hypothetical protein
MQHAGLKDNYHGQHEPRERRVKKKTPFSLPFVSVRVVRGKKIYDIFSVSA